MARIRTIKPEFFRHESLFEAEQETGLPLRLAFAGLWTAADREGRFKWSPRALKLDCLPYDDVDFSRVLDALATRGFIVSYSVDGSEYGYIPKWNNHQAINNRESPSVIPAPNEIKELTRQPRVSHASATPLCNAQGEGKGREGKGKDSGPSAAGEFQLSSPMSAEEEFWGLTDTASKSGITRSRMGQLAKLCDGDHTAALAILKVALKAKTPSSYLAKTAEKMKAERATPQSHAPPDDSGQPDFVAAWRASGLAVERHPSGWKCQGFIYDEAGQEIGF